jgi:hypothetical protein
MQTRFFRSPGFLILLPRAPFGIFPRSLVAGGLYGGNIWFTSRKFCIFEIVIWDHPSTGTGFGTWDNIQEAGDKLWDDDIDLGYEVFSV